MAQTNVYSLNVVGYYNITVPANQLALIANQLNTTNNMLSTLIPNGPANAQVFKYNGGYSGTHFDDVDLAWEPDFSLNPGEGCFYTSPAATTLTFVGEVLQGNLVNTLPIGQLSMRSSMVPQQADLGTLGVPGEPNDQVYVYQGGYTGTHFDDVDLAWEPDLTINVGDAFFYKKNPVSVSSTWVRNFTVQ
jgi:hypothetical protein